jgi:hypothetical protein
VSAIPPELEDAPEELPDEVPPDDELPDEELPEAELLEEEPPEELLEDEPLEEAASEEPPEEASAEPLEEPSSPTIASLGIPLELLELLPELFPDPPLALVLELPPEPPPAVPSTPSPPSSLGLVPLDPPHAAIERHISALRIRMLERTMAKASPSAQKRQH